MVCIDVFFPKSLTFEHIHLISHDYEHKFKNDWQEFILIICMIGSF